MDLLKSIEAYAFNHPSKLKRKERKFNAQQIVEQLVEAQRNGVDVKSELESAYMKLIPENVKKTVDIDN